MPDNVQGLLARVSESEAVLDEVSAANGAGNWLLAAATRLPGRQVYTGAFRPRDDPYRGIPLRISASALWA